MGTPSQLLAAVAAFLTEANLHDAAREYFLINLEVYMLSYAAFTPLVKASSTGNSS